MASAVSPSTGILRVENLCFAYDGIPVLDSFSLSVAEGEFVVLLGASGCGKSTFLRLLAGLERPSSGEIFWRGKPVSGPSLERGIVFQEYALFPWLRLRDNVALAVSRSAPELSKRERVERAGEYLDMVGLGSSGRKYPHELSGGMRQRGAIARTLALGSPLLLMDEPFGALDPANRMRLQELVLEIWAGTWPRRTVVFVTHDVDEALLLGDRALLLGSNPGRILEEIVLRFPRPRSLEALLATEDFRSLQAAVSVHYHRDAKRQLYAGSLTPGEGI